MKLDILVIAAHPDDAELMCGGTIIKHVELGYKVGIIDLTEGELGTRGSVETRYKEAEAAGKIMGISVRENLKFRDGWFIDDEAHRLKVIAVIRKYRPDIILTNAINERHPDHSKASKLVSESSWLSGLSKIETFQDRSKQDAWRPGHVYHGIQYNVIDPDFVVDIAGYADKKMEAIMAYRSQFYDPNGLESNTLISKPEFLDLLKAKMANAGNYAHLDQAEGFTSAYKPGVKNLFDLI